MPRPRCDFCNTRETRRNVLLRHVDDGCSGVHDPYACDRCWEERGGILEPYWIKHPDGTVQTFDRWSAWVDTLFELGFTVPGLEGYVIDGVSWGRELHNEEPPLV